jgi:threonylcarbamoyladenosine tRNA methylthiotransferase MtaB
MRRRYDTALYRDKIMRIKAISPLCCIGVDVIVGFPGETEQAFEDTYHFLQELPVSYLHVFPFSPRVNTLAAAMEGQVAEEVKYQRVKKLRELSEEKKKNFL